MSFEHVRIEALGVHLPEERVTSLELEERLAPLYERLSLSPGRLELMSGIAERRFFPPGTRPSAVAAAAAEDALARSGVARERIGLLIHGAVCRDFLEPATAAVVHGRLALPDTCLAYDLSNACLGVASGVQVAAEQIERGTLEAALVVSGEDGRALVEQTLAHLLAQDDDREARRALKRAYASLTIGAGGAAVLLARDDVATSGHRLLGVTSRADTAQVHLCEGDVTGSGAPLMETDSEALLRAGNALAARTFEAFLEERGWTRADVERVITHQVGAAHRRLLFETLELDPALDFPTVHFLGNVGTVSWPATLALAEREGFVRPGQRTAVLAIGSGLQCQMLGLEW